MTAEDFRRSATASGPPLVDERLALGEKIFHAVAATRQTVGCNTNLGIVLLAAPLLSAYQTSSGEGDLRTALRRVLSSTTRNDADWAYRAIRLAAPGGLGHATEADVHATPTITLQAAMTLAGDRDRVAFQYASGYRDVFDFAIPRYHTARLRWENDAWTAVWVFLGILKRFPDSHLERKYGPRHNGLVAARAAELERALDRSEKPDDALDLLRRVDAEFKSNGINPGTTADLTVACLLAVRLEALLSHRKQKASALLGAGNANAPAPASRR
jgi:triphosphoribosyl-dephospho-CoA synthase